ncbi:MAG: alpha/beta fold hydrolase [Deltaproteobacteria bacterium]|nr:alpha/beta fold hydrolase [Deltaproteobacteria bacterium]
MPLVEINGRRLCYRVRGEGRPAVLLLHGAGASSLHFLELANRLGRGRRVVALDLPGHGRSPALTPLPRPESLLGAYRDAALALAERLGLGRYVVLGHSMGGAVALELALGHPERLAGLVLLSSAARLGLDPELGPRLGRPEAVTAWLAARGYSPTASARQVELWAARHVQCGPALLRADFLACDAADLTAQLPEVKVPTLVVGGADDRITPPELQERLARAIPRARLELLARTGHFAYWERPEALAAVVSAASFSA